MKTLAEIEAAADALSSEEKRQLLQFLLTRLLDRETSLPEPRTFTRNQIARWIAQDEADMRRFQEGE